MRLIACMVNLFEGTDFEPVQGKFGATVDEAAHRYEPKIKENEIFERMLLHLAKYALIQQTTERLDKPPIVLSTEQSPMNRYAVKKVKLVVDLKERLKSADGKYQAMVSIAPGFADYVKQ